MMLQKELRKLIWPFLVPSLLLYLVIGLWPNIEAFYWALTEYDGVAPTQTFIGLRNFHYMMNDIRWWSAAGNTLYLAVGTVVTLLPFGMLFAVLIMSVRRGHGFFKATVYIPSILSLVIVAFLWAFILDPTIGLLNDGLKAVGLTDPIKRLLGVNSLNWLTHPKLAKPSIIVVQLWSALGFYTLLFLAGLAKIPSELYDAAKIDGAGGLGIFRHVTWPLLFPTTQTVFLLLIINGLQIFTLVYALGGGGVLPMTQVMATYIYRTAFTDRRFGYATALSVFLMVVVMVFTLASRELTKRETIQY
jgi:raffinose/stachyose/melibiose transport system permease protein